MWPLSLLYCIDGTLVLLSYHSLSLIFLQSLSLSVALLPLGLSLSYFTYMKVRIYFRLVCLPKSGHIDNFVLKMSCNESMNGIPHAKSMNGMTHSQSRLPAWYVRSICLSVAKVRSIMLHICSAKVANVMAFSFHIHIPKKACKRDGSVTWGNLIAGSCSSPVHLHFKNSADGVI